MPLMPLIWRSSLPPQVRLRRMQFARDCADGARASLINSFRKRSGTEKSRPSNFGICLDGARSALNGLQQNGRTHLDLIGLTHVESLGYTPCYVTQPVPVCTVCIL